jgi:hypothetical protein
MDAFGYLSVLLSIILGLGLTQLLTAIGRLIRHRDRVRVHWLPLLWAALLLLIYVQVWWSMYGLRLHREWTFLAFGAVLAQTATLYVMAAVALPEQVEEAGADLARTSIGIIVGSSGFLATLVVSVVKMCSRRPTSGAESLSWRPRGGLRGGADNERRRYQEVLAVASRSRLWRTSAFFARSAPSG